MGFISGTSTVTVQARLTNYGKKKLYESIESNSGNFVTKFALGDSDSNYVAISDGAGPLDSGFVPEAGDFQSRPRSFALYQGSYRPGKPVILVNGDPMDTVGGMLSIGGNGTRSVTFELATEWPKDEPFSEGYDYELINPTSINDERFAELFSVTMLEGNTLQVTYNGGANLAEILVLTGNFAYESDVSVTVVGQQTKKVVDIHLIVVQ